MQYRFLAYLGGLIFLPCNFISRNAHAVPDEIFDPEDFKIPWDVNTCNDFPEKNHEKTNCEFTFIR